MISSPFSAFNCFNVLPLILVVGWFFFLEEINHNGTKLMNTLNNYNLFVVQNNNHTSMTIQETKWIKLTIQYILVLFPIYPVLVLNLTYLLKLYHKAIWSKINENIKTKLSKLSGGSTLLKRDSHTK